MAVPLVANEEAIGVLMLFHPEPSVFTAQHVELVEAAAIQVAIAINNANLFRYIREQSDRVGTLLQDEKIEAAKSQAILESIADGVIVADEDSKIILANETAVSILGISQRQLITRQMKNLVGIYGRSSREWLQTIDQWREKPEAIESGVFLREQFEVGGKVVLVHLSPVLVQGEYVGTVSIFRDITKEAEVDKLKTNFISTVSHELRTPMTSIKGYADLLATGLAGDLNEAQTGFLEVIQRNLGRMSDLIRDLSEINHLESGRVQFEKRPFNFHESVDEVVDSWSERLKSREQTLVLDVPSDLPLVYADPKRVGQVFSNLVSNANKYTMDGGTVTIAIHPADAFLHVAVRDTGIGITEEDQEKLFTQFFRASDQDVRDQVGWGLGLSIVKSMVEAQGGEIMFESVHGEGSTFAFTVPLAEEN